MLLMDMDEQFIMSPKIPFHYRRLVRQSKLIGYVIYFCGFFLGEGGVDEGMDE